MLKSPDPGTTQASSDRVAWPSYTGVLSTASTVLSGGSTMRSHCEDAVLQWVVGSHEQSQHSHHGNITPSHSTSEQMFAIRKQT